MMFKVVFVDDEFLIVEGLKKIINWEEFNISVAGTASNAHEGIELVQSTNPDILITDIKMKGADGLEMLSKLKAIGYSGYIIILSGYQEFEYAQKAIENGVYRYLLKPIDIPVLTNIISDISAKLSTQKSKPEHYSSELDKAVAYIESHFNEDIALNKLAEMFHFEISHFSRSLKKRFGMTYTDYIIGLRINMAKEYLIKTNYSIETIATIVGYKDDKYFRETFKKYANVSPAKYRKEGLELNEQQRD